MRSCRPMIVALAALFCLLMSPFAARGDGFIIIHPTSTPVPVPRGHFSFAPLEVSFHHVSVEINDQVAVTSVDQEFVNPNSQRLEGTYMFPLPPGAHIDKFSMDVNGRMGLLLSIRRPVRCRCRRGISRSRRWRFRTTT